MNMKKQKIFKVLVSLFIAILLIANVSLASYDNVTMEVVDEPVCRIDITDKSYFEKRIIDTDLPNKNVTIQLKVVNGEETIIPNGEIVFLIDNSNSMTLNIANKSRAQMVRDSAKELISKLLESNSELKIGIASFSTESDTSEGTEADARLVSELSSDAEALGSAIDGIVMDGPRTDLDAGITCAKKIFSQDDSTEKYMVILTDGIPNVAVGVKEYFSQEVVDKTKENLKSLETAGINTITVLTEIANGDQKPMPNINKTNNDFVKEVFGTPANPNIGKFFYVADQKLEETISEEIFKNLSPQSRSLTNLVIRDHFPQEIVDNFDFEYVQDPNFGTITPTINTNYDADNNITWSIPELQSGETAIVQYKLSLKKDYDPNIVEDILPTNKNIEFEYTDLDGNEKEETSDVTPKLKLSEPLPVLPKAGITIAIIAGIAIVGVGIFSFHKYSTIKQNLEH